MKKILIVEDDQHICLALAIRLRSNGYVVCVAHDAVAGAKAAEEERPDLLLLDISMPGGSGFTVAEHVQKITAAARIPVIFITASKQAIFRVKALGLHAAAFFDKPLDSEALLAAIREALDPTSQQSPAPPSSTPRVFHHLPDPTVRTL